MFGMGLSFLIAALVAATFGFGGIESSFAGLARGLSLVLFFGFGLCLLMPAVLEARNIGASRSREALNAGAERESVAL